MARENEVIDYVELVGLFRRRRLKLGNCLLHVRVALDVWYERRLELLVCMAPVSTLPPDRPMHCWLESGDVVIDLTTKGRLWDRGEFYARRGVDAGKLRRYSLGEISGQMAAGRAIEFWGFEQHAPDPNPSTNV